MLHVRDVGERGTPSTFCRGYRRLISNSSPEDQATLEAEYEKNSKPDKAARAEIVKRVALGEKEVQVSRIRPLRRGFAVNP